VFGLIQPDFAAARQFHLSDASPSLFVDWSEADLLPLQRLHHRFQVIAHKVEFVKIVLLRRMKGRFGSWHGEQQPSVAGVD